MSKGVLVLTIREDYDIGRIRSEPGIGRKKRNVNNRRSWRSLGIDTTWTFPKKKPKSVLGSTFSLSMDFVMDGGCAHRLFGRLVGRVGGSVGRLGGGVWDTTCLNAALMVARLSVLGTLTSCLRERTECGRSSFLPIYPLF